MHYNHVWNSQTMNYKINSRSLTFRWSNIIWSWPSWQHTKDSVLYGQNNANLLVLHQEWLGYPGHIWLHQATISLLTTGQMLMTLGGSQAAAENATVHRMNHSQERMMWSPVSRELRLRDHRQTKVLYHHSFSQRNNFLLAGPTQL